jgi:hypothetical protein
MDHKKILDIANDLSNEDICELINLVGDRLDVFFGCLNGHQLSSGVAWATMNGTLIQINCESASLEDLTADRFMAGAINFTKGA